MRRRGVPMIKVDASRESTVTSILSTGDTMSPFVMLSVDFEWGSHEQALKTLAAAYEDAVEQIKAVGSG